MGDKTRKVTLKIGRLAALKTLPVHQGTWESTEWSKAATLQPPPSVPSVNVIQ